MKKYFIFIIAALLTLPLLSCQKQEEKQAAKPKARISGPIIADPSTTTGIKAQDIKIIVPDDIKAESVSKISFEF